MRVPLRMQPLTVSFIKRVTLAMCINLSVLLPITTFAEVINIPIHRTIATQPITELEIIAIVKSMLNGRVLSIKKQSSYTNPDCHQVKLLEDQGEFQIIKLGCYAGTVMQAKQE